MKWIGTLLMALILSAITSVGAQDAQITPEATDEPVDNALGGTAAMADRLIVFTGTAAWESATTSTLTAIRDGKLFLADERPKAFPRRGIWVSPVITGDFPITEILPSWNVDTPENTGATFEVRVLPTGSEEWSDYVYMGQWGRTPHPPSRTLDTGMGEVRIDVLRLKESASALQLRVRLYSYDLGPWRTPALRRLTAVYSGPASGLPDGMVPYTNPVSNPERRTVLPVPFTPQGDNPSAIAGSTCSPTSVRMVMAYRGVDLPLTEVALGIYDPEYGLFGNWNRAVAYAAGKGLTGWLTRVRTWDQVEQYIADGQPIIASIRFRRGEFPNNVIKSTNGHLIVIRGMTPEGDLVINDPASRDRGEGVVYTRAEMQNAWLDKGGVAYILAPPTEQ